MSTASGVSVPNPVEPISTIAVANSSLEFNMSLERHSLSSTTGLQQRRLPTRLPTRRGSERTADSQGQDGGGGGNDLQNQCLKNVNTQHAGFKMHIATQVLQFTIFTIVIIINITKLLDFMRIYTELFLFICINMALILAQVIIYSVLQLKKFSIKQKLVIHLLIQISVVTLLIKGCFMTLKQSSSKANKQEEEDNNSDHQYSQINFVVSMMIWFRFIETFLCSCTYINLAMMVCTDRYEFRLQQAHSHRINQVMDQQKAEIDKFIEDNGRIYSKSELHRQSTCPICLEDFCIGDDLVELKCTSKHIYHTECIRGWMQAKLICPLCRVVIEL